MALSKTISIKGASLSYWKVSGLRWDDRDNMTRVTVTPYVSEATRGEDINNRLGEFSQEYLLAGCKTVPEAYTTIKGMPGWEGAVDLLTQEQLAAIDVFIQAAAAISIEPVKDEPTLVDDVASDPEVMEVEP